MPELTQEQVGRTKLDDCVDNLVEIYHKTESFRGTQVVFSDSGTPSNKGKAFNVYNYIKQALIKKGIPEEEVCFIHDAKDDAAKKQMHEDMRTGTKRIIIGSTNKLGTGTNIQNLLVAEHDIDVPWCPKDIEQREGRILRQGNRNKAVYIFRYVTEGTFDAYNWNIVENKQRFISPMMHTGELIDREHEDICENVIKYEELVALASGNPLMKERIEVDSEIRRLEILKRSYQKTLNETNTLIKNVYPEKIANIEKNIEDIKEDISLAEKNKIENDNFTIVISGKVYTDRRTAGAAIMSIVKSKKNMYEEVQLGTYRGFTLTCLSRININAMERTLYVKGKFKYALDITETTENGVVIRIDNTINKIPECAKNSEKNLEQVKNSLEAAKAEVKKPFAHKEKLENLKNRLEEIQKELFVEDKDMINDKKRA